MTWQAPRLSRLRNGLASDAAFALAAADRILGAVQRSGPANSDSAGEPRRQRGDGLTGRSSEKRPDEA